MTRNRRSSRSGSRRVDAAIDALLPFGFSKSTITCTVNKLLKVYGGDSGWLFIEEASYRLLIDTILEDQEKCLPKDASEEEDGEIKHAAPSEPENANTAIQEALCEKEGTVNTQHTNISALSIERDTGPIAPRVKRGIGPVAPRVEREIGPISPSVEMGTDHIKRVTDQIQRETDQLVRGNVNEHREREIGHLERETNDSRSGGVRRRAPCYGWLDEEDSFVPTKPAIERKLNASVTHTSVLGYEGTKTHVSPSEALVLLESTPKDMIEREIGEFDGENHDSVLLGCPKTLATCVQEPLLRDPVPMESASPGREGTESDTVMAENSETEKPGQQRKGETIDEFFRREQMYCRGKIIYERESDRTRDRTREEIGRSDSSAERKRRYEERESPGSHRSHDHTRRCHRHSQRRHRYHDTNRYWVRDYDERETTHGRDSGSSCKRLRVEEED
ncbi:hypothetical protein AMTRI_Chr08g202090 [Amborella trichopoda]